ncbi:MAG: pitrilysin family protein [Clostridia bacterium]|nr:pitrilysin family protein [Clostridia bacterium]
MFEYKTLSNGIRVVAEKIPYLRSVSLGVWVGSGSRYETEKENGISHFIEHMLFKGTNRRDAARIAAEIDAVGGQINAFTAREYTCFYTKTLDEHIETAADVLSDILFNSRLDERDMELERRVICEEISLYEDSPEDLVYDILYEAVWKGTPMGRSILGTPESLSGITSELMRDYMRRHYTCENTVIAVSGNFDAGLFELLEKYFGAREIEKSTPKPPKAVYKPGKALKCKDIEQVQLAISFEGIDIFDETVYSLLAFNNVFGCGMSSRLFQNIREKRGLVYSIGAGHSAYDGTGIFDISAGMSPERLPEVAELIVGEIKRIKSEKLTSAELARAKEQLKGNYILSCESTGARMQSAGRSLLINKPMLTQEEVIKKIEAVTADDAADMIDRIFNSASLSAAAVGPVDNIDGIFDLF